MLDRFNAIAEEMATELLPTSCSTRWASCRSSSTTATPGTSTPSSSRRWTRCAARRRTPTSTSLSGGERRRVALCKLLLQQPDLLLLDEPTNHLDAESVQWLEQHLAKYPGAVLAVTHDRYFLDNVAEWILELDRGHAYPYEGNYSTYLETKQTRLKIEGNKDAKRQKGSSASSSGCAPARRPARPRARPGSAGTRSWSPRRTRPASSDIDEIHIPPGPRLGGVVIEVDKLVKGFGDRVLIDGPVVQPAPRRHRRRHRPERRRQDHAVQDDRRARRSRTPARSRSARRSRSPTSTSAAAASTRRRTLWEVVSDGLDYIKVGNVEINSPRLRRRRSGSRARTSRSRPGCCPVASATGSTWR